MTSLRETLRRQALSNKRHQIHLDAYGHTEGRVQLIPNGAYSSPVHPLDDEYVPYDYVEAFITGDTDDIRAAGAVVALFFNGEDSSNIITGHELLLGEINVLTPSVGIHSFQIRAVVPGVNPFPTNFNVHLAFKRRRITSDIELQRRKAAEYDGFLKV